MSEFDIEKLKPAEIAKFVVEGSKFVFKPEAEVPIIKLIEERNRIAKIFNEKIASLDAKLEEIKVNIMKAGESINPNFPGVIGGRLNLTSRKYGEKFKYDKSQETTALPFLKKVTFYKVESEKVDEYKAKNKKVPEGIIENERKKVVSFTIKDEQTKITG